VAVDQAGAREVPDRVVDGIAVRKLTWAVREFADDLVDRALCRIGVQKDRQDGPLDALVLVAGRLGLGSVYPHASAPLLARRGHGGLEAREQGKARRHGLDGATHRRELVSAGLG